MQDNQPERQRAITLRFLAEPAHINFGGKVHGGAVMKWLDQAGYTCAANWTGSYCVTAYVSGIQFLSPIHVGDIVELRASVIRTGRTSLDVAVDISARSPQSSERRRTGHCVVVFVAVDDQGKPKPVPRWEPETELDRALEDYARRLAQLRKETDVALEERLAALGVQPTAGQGEALQGG
ncbi:MAG TPA: acyl-CoA thioesterase [Gammaproteobacteria bacterium]|nr:acyl-CoA thioesterase [Gammaproteobacteria bacterium]